MRASRRVAAQDGFTLTEMLIAVGIMLTITGGVFTVMNPSQGTFQAQPEVSDMQQRMRVGVDMLSKDLLMAGAGIYAGASAGALSYFFAPVMPYHFDDPAKNVFYRPDAISMVYVPITPSQTTIRDPMPANSAEIKVQPQPNCPGNNLNQLCGFEVGMRLIIFDTAGNFDLFTVTQVQDAAAHLQHRNDKFNVSYAAGSAVTQIRSATYYLKTDEATKRYQLMYHDGWQTDTPVVDDVVKLEFEYYGDPQPPQLIPNKPLTDPVGPWTTYGPKPPPLGVNEGSTTWPAGENCTFRLQGGTQIPRLPTLSVGLGQVRLEPAILTDGPWCPDGSNAGRFDADLLRVRRVRVKLRVQAALAALRGPAGVLFTRGGTSTSPERYVPDQEISFDVTPRNMNLGR